MKIDSLIPPPEKRELFAWSHHSRVPAQPGCYALTNFSGDVLYVGQAKVSIRDRMGVHLDDGEKRAVGAYGAAYWFYYTLREPKDLGHIEGGWINQSILETGERPPLNKVDSPV
jgi:hypothetical protein